MAFDRPPFVSEREGKHQFPTGVIDTAADEDCVFAAGLMQANAIVGNILPATLHEAERIRAAAGLGPSGPSNSDDLIRGLQKHYGFAPRKVAGFGQFDFDAFWEQLTPGMCATAGGFISNLPNTHKLAEFLPGFKPGHRVYIQRETEADEVWWMDPEGLPKKTYKGTMASKAALRTFMKNGSGATIDRIGRLKEHPMIIISDRTPKLVTTSPGAQYFDLNGAEVSEAFTQTERISPYGIRIGDDDTFRVVDVHSQSLDVFRLLAVKPGPLVTVTDAPAAAPVIPLNVAEAFERGKQAEWDRQFLPGGVATITPGPRP